ncbi:MAG TPA: hypothetical protein VHZ54_12975 [Solirubrobacterales bacterium]|nr:hypothetical protein [Solirubrobacterales bacterium]
MSVMEGEWTDKRMDDFAARVDRFEANVDKRFDKVDADIKTATARGDAQFEVLSTKIDRLGYRMWTPWIVIAGVLIAKIIFG